jgi:hypothetical protein
VITLVVNRQNNNLAQKNNYYMDLLEQVLVFNLEFMVEYNQYLEAVK